MDPVLWPGSSGERASKHVWNGGPEKLLRSSAFLNPIIGEEENRYGYRYACSPGPVWADL